MAIEDSDLGPDFDFAGNAKQAALDAQPVTFEALNIAMQTMRESPGEVARCAAALEQQVQALRDNLLRSACPECPHQYCRAYRDISVRVTALLGKP